MLTWTRPQTLQSQEVLWEKVCASICRCLVHVGQREPFLSLNIRGKYFGNWRKRLQDVNVPKRFDKKAKFRSDVHVLRKSKADYIFIRTTTCWFFRARSLPS